MKIICYRLNESIDLSTHQELTFFQEKGAHMLINFGPGMAHIIALDHVSEIKHELQANLGVDVSVLDKNDIYTSLYVSTKPDFEKKFLEHVTDNLKFDYHAMQNTF